MTYLITGATGDVGSRVVKFLLKHGDRPRVFVRDEKKAQDRYGDSAEIFVGDLVDTKSLAAALKGVESLFLINTGQDIATRDGEAANVARAAGVHHIVKLSSLDSRQRFGTGVWHAEGEAAIRAVGIAFTFVQPSGFMSNALFWADFIKREGVVRSCTGDGKIAFIHPDDIAAVATKALMTREYYGESLAITGPEALSYSEMTAKIGTAIGRRLAFQTISEEQERNMLVTSGASDSEIDYHLSIYRAIREGRAAMVTDTVERVLGRKPMTFAEWAKDNAAEFL